MRPIARLETELRMSGIGQSVAGVVALVIALAVGDEGVARVLVPFAAAAVLLAALSAWSTRWLRAPAIPEAGGQAVEPSGETVRRSLVILALPVVVLAILVGIAAPVAAVLGGVLVGAGAVDLRNLAWVRERERALGRGIYRELGRSPFAGGRRPLYTRP